ncbi:MAG: hypothetical protein H7X95_03545 [Deltaproteobacteria bacterium]|nr:hypothetical protein [Deltaproteobacteria bacterium]
MSSTAASMVMCRYLSPGLLFLSLAFGCGTEEEIRPFGDDGFTAARGGEVGGAAGGKIGEGLVRGQAGATGIRTVLTTGSGGSGGAQTGGGIGTVGGMGTVGSGGRVAASGGTVASASGGGTGTGGTSASGGATSTGGTTGSSAECAQYIRDYDAEMPNARACKFTVNLEKSCVVLVPQRLAGCGSKCTTYVDKANTLDQIQKKWAKAGCIAPACEDSECDEPALPSGCSILTGMCTWNSADDG